MSISTRLLASAAYFTVAISAPILTFAPTAASAQVEIAVVVKIAPPPLVVYEQPPIPAAGYLWTPGYWAWDADDSDYYWAPGAWAQPPQVGYYWTPGYWAWDNGAYAYKVGYWGPTVGYYGGVDYGYGYTSQGYYGGRWRNNTFEYNRTVNNITNVNITNVYEEPAPRGESHASYNGGPGGVQVKPTAEQLAASRGPHVEATAAQTERYRTAQQDKQSHFKANNGKPPEPVAKVEEKPAASGAMKGPAETKTEAEKPGAKSDMKTEAEKPGMKSDTKAEAEKPGMKPDTKTEAEKPAMKPETKTEAEKPGMKPDTKTEAEKPAMKPDAKAEAEKPGMKSDTKTEAEKPAMKPETKTEAERPTEKPVVKTEAEHPAVKAIEKAPPEKMQKVEKPAAAHAEPQPHAEGEKKDEPKKE